MKISELLAQARRKRKHPGDEEHRLQCECFRVFGLRYRQLAGRLFAVPNGGRRDAVTAAKLKAEGVVAGVADLILLVPNDRYGALLIEMKTPKGRQSTSQKAWQKKVEEDYKYVVCRSVREFLQAVEQYLQG